MLFNSFSFLLLFLPFALGGYYLLIRAGLRKWLFAFLVFASLIFYSVWNPPYVLLLLGSMGGNYLAGLWIERRRLAGTGTGLPLWLGIGANLLVLGYFKYTNFALDTLGSLTGSDTASVRIILPLAISFYTFQQIAYLVDIARGEVRSGGIARYMTFVIFFPQLIAGPIVHYRDMMPQFFGRNLGRFWRADLLIGLTIFAIGLFKKTVIADSAATFASPVFDTVNAGGTIGFWDSWKAAICYTIQLYFDFSGYSDMAIGLARMFGIRLPPNFHSPLRAASIIDYWRQWHITLQQFIVAYMYQPLVLPLARISAARGLGKWPTFGLTVAFPTVSLFMIIGLWHGAGWTFVLFGLMHGVYLAVNEFWRALRRKSRRKSPPDAGSMLFYHVLTLLCVVVANVMFRAESVGDAWQIWLAMLGAGAPLAMDTGALLAGPLPLIAVSLFLVFFCPNTQQLMGRYQPVWGWEKWRRVAPPVISLTWRPTLPWAIWTGVVLSLALAFILRDQTEFIYFNF